MSIGEKFLFLISVSFLFLTGTGCTLQNTVHITAKNQMGPLKVNHLSYSKGADSSLTLVMRDTSGIFIHELKIDKETKKVSSIKSKVTNLPEKRKELFVNDKKFMKKRLTIYDQKNNVRQTLSLFYIDQKQSSTKYAISNKYDKQGRLYGVYFFVKGDTSQFEVIYSKEGKKFNEEAKEELKEVFNTKKKSGL